MGRKLFGFQQLAVAAKGLGLVLFFYTFSISLTFYNKWMMKVRMDRLRLGFCDDRSSLIFVLFSFFVFCFRIW